MKEKTNRICKKCKTPIYRCSEVVGSINTTHGERQTGNIWLECQCGYSNESLGWFE